MLSCYSRMRWLQEGIGSLKYEKAFNVSYLWKNLFQKRNPEKNGFFFITSTSVHENSISWTEMKRMIHQERNMYLSIYSYITTIYIRKNHLESLDICVFFNIPNKIINTIISYVIAVYLHRINCDTNILLNAKIRLDW